METTIIQDFTLERMEGIYLLRCASGTFRIWLEMSELERIVRQEPLEFIPALRVILNGKGKIPFVKTRLYLMRSEEGIYVLDSCELIVEPISEEVAGITISEAEQQLNKLRHEKNELVGQQYYEAAAAIRDKEKQLQNLLARLKEYDRLRSL